MKSIIDKIIDQIEEYKVDIMDLAIKEQLPNFSVEKIKEIIIDFIFSPYLLFILMLICDLPLLMQFYNLLHLQLLCSFLVC